MIYFLLYSNLLTVIFFILYSTKKHIDISNKKYINYKLPSLLDKDYEKINGISLILWINLDRSKERKIKLLEILNKVKIKNTMIRAIDGKKENVFDYILTNKDNNMDCTDNNMNCMDNNMNCMDDNMECMDCMDNNMDYMDCMDNNMDNHMDNHMDNNGLIDFNNKKLNNGEIACCLSHIKAISYIQYLIDINKDNGKSENIEEKYVLIIEDDIKIDYLSIIHKDIKEIISNCPYDFDILMLYSTKNSILIEEYTNKKDKLVGGACAYVIKKDRIYKLLDIIFYDFHLNKFIVKQKIKLQHSDYLIFYYFNTYIYKYNFFNTCDDETTLHTKYLKYFKKSNMINKKMIVKELVYNIK